MFCVSIVQARQEYTELVEVTNSFQNDLCLNELPHALMSMRETAEQMISVVQTALKSFEMQQVSLIGSVGVQLVSVLCMYVSMYVCTYMYVMQNIT